jgi:hypothetical protein
MRCNTSIAVPRSPCFLNAEHHRALRLLPDRTGPVVLLKPFGDLVYWREFEGKMVAPSVAGLCGVVERQRSASERGGGGTSSGIPEVNDILTPDQIADLAGISQICEELGADLVVIGATSLLILMGDLGALRAMSISPLRSTSMSSSV